MSIKPLINAIFHLDRNLRIKEVCSSNFNSRCTGKHKFNGIMSITNTAKSDNRNINGFCHLPYHTHCNRLDSWTAESTSIDTQHRFSFLNINSHPHEGIDKRNAVSTLCLYSTCYLRYVRNVRGELDYQRFMITLSYGLNNTCSSGTCYAKSHPTVFYIRT